MKFSLNLAQKYSNVDLKSIVHSNLVQRIGAQLGAIEETIDWAAKYQDIVVARVVSVDKHTDADKLTICRIDDGGVTENIERGEDGFVQVVCGAPNVEEGQTVVWVPPGATVPSTLGKEPFILEAKEIRGVVSNGMIASSKELAIDDGSGGILVLNEEAEGTPEPGHSILRHLGLNDFVVDCENKMFTHRPDCFGNLGIAREIAGIFGEKFQSPDWYTQKPEFITVSDLPITVINEVLDLVPRFCGVAMKNLKVEPSPTWLVSLLTRVGIKPINTVVDITNYVMHLTGQPLHAFDYDKLQKFSKAPTLMPRMAQNDEEITLLGGKKVKLSENDIVISTDTTAVALAGVMGGAETEVDESTTNIVIECANFDMYAVRRTSMRYGLFTDAVTRFNKGQSPLQNDRVLAYTMRLLSDYAGGEQASSVFDVASFDANADNLNKVTVTSKFINDRLGSSLTPQQIKELLESVEFGVNDEADTLNITVPFWRMDVTIGEDVVEEVGRLYGYDKLPVSLPVRPSKPTTKNAQRSFVSGLRHELGSVGANEVLTYSFVHGKLMQDMGIDPDKWAYHLRNAISPNLQYYRTSLIPSLLAKIRGNIKAQAGDNFNEFVLFEFGKTHVKGDYEEDEESLPKQMRRLALVVAADTKTANMHAGSAFYQAKKYLDHITDAQATYEPLESTEYPMTAPYQEGRSATVKVGGHILGVIGEFHAKAKRSLKLPDYCAGFELDTDLLLANLAEKSYKPLSTFPSTTQDMTFETSGNLTWAEVYKFLHAELEVAGVEFGYNYVLKPLDIYQPEKSNKKRISFRIELAHDNKTLKTEEVNTLLDQTAKAMHEKLHTTRI